MEVTALVTRLAPPLHSYCRARTYCASLAEEAAQDALTALVERYRRDDPPDDPAAFVFTIARRRLRRRMRWLRARLPLDATPEPVATAADPERVSAQRERLHLVTRALSRLEAPEREALLLGAVEGLDTDAAARRLGISRSAFKMRTHRARRRLAAWLGVLCLAVLLLTLPQPTREEPPTAPALSASGHVRPAAERQIRRTLTGSGDAVALVERVEPVTSPGRGSLIVIRHSSATGGS